MQKICTKYYLSISFVQIHSIFFANSPKALRRLCSALSEKACPFSRHPEQQV